METEMDEDKCIAGKGNLKETLGEWEASPWPYLNDLFELKSVNDNSCVMQCKLCQPKVKELSTYKNLASNMCKHVAYRSGESQEGVWRNESVGSTLGDRIAMTIPAVHTARTCGQGRQNPELPASTPHPDITLSLRLYPAILMDNDEDEDGNFTKWMSSYWGHWAGDGGTRQHHRSFRRPSQPRPSGGRRASLPCQSQLNTMQVKLFRMASPTSLPPHGKSLDRTDSRPSPCTCPASSDKGSHVHVKSPLIGGRIGTVWELSESLGKRLYLHSRGGVSPSDADDLCLICPEAGGRETRCGHRPLKEGERPEWRLSGSGNRGSGAAGVAVSTACNVQRSGDSTSCVEGHRQTHRKLSLRRQR